MFSNHMKLILEINDKNITRKAPIISQLNEALFGGSKKKILMKIRKCLKLNDTEDIAY